eukprot:TRINITY_DN54874_c0_g1_i1.p1 TRINITY_DN54874_c0_g1~~TRINITY_DN54874_c0_g1_i1.p1  ORF type:complete len:159 (+),score=17.80 TRINITY_DN54874_c0_g1_i1:22-477(+)
MGNCFASLFGNSNSEAKEGLVSNSPKKPAKGGEAGRTRTFQFRTPGEYQLRILQNSFVSMEVVASDKGRTIDVEFFESLAQKEKFEQSIQSIGTRVHSDHPLSAKNWKTGSDLKREARLEKGLYYICAVSSSVIRDKEVELSFRVTMTPVK